MQLAYEGIAQGVAYSPFVVFEAALVLAIASVYMDLGTLAVRSLPGSLSR